MDQAIAATAGRLDDAASWHAAGEGTASPTTGSLPDARRHLYAGREWTSEHPLNIRLSLPLVFGRYYITIVAGKERRARARLSLDRRQHPLATIGNIAFMFLIGIVTATGGVTLGYMLLADLFGWSGRLMP